MKPTPIFCLECQDTGWIEPVEFGQLSQPCPHCDTGADVDATYGKDEGSGTND